MAPVVKKKAKKRVPTKLPPKPAIQYRDPLHVPSAQLVVMHKGKEAILLNKHLMDRQNCWENLEKIKNAHQRKLLVYDAINMTDDAVDLAYFGHQLKAIEYELQQYWKFSIDENFHRIWEYPKCACPVLDNRERYPHGHIINSNCPLHGGTLQKKVSFTERAKSFILTTLSKLHAIGKWPF